MIYEELLESKINRICELGDMIKYLDVKREGVTIIKSHDDRWGVYYRSIPCYADTLFAAIDSWIDNAIDELKERDNKEEKTMNKENTKENRWHYDETHILDEDGQLILRPEKRVVTTNNGYVLCTIEPMSDKTLEMWNGGWIGLEEAEPDDGEPSNNMIVYRSGKYSESVLLPRRAMEYEIRNWLWSDSATWQAEKVAEKGRIGMESAS